MKYTSSFLGSFALLALVNACHPKAPPPAPVEESKAVRTDAGVVQVWLDKAERDEAKIRSEAVVEREVDDTIIASGRVSFDDKRVSHVFSPVTGRVVRIGGQLGQRVKKGDALAVIESPDIGSAVSDVHKAEADVTAAQHDLDRQKKLFENHAVSRAIVEQSEDNCQKAHAELTRAQEKAKLLRTGSVDTVTQTYTLVAPIDGEIIARTISPGIEVQGQYGGGTPVELFTVGETDHVWVMADLYEMDFSRVEKGTPARVRVVAYPNRDFPCKVDFMPKTIDPATRTAHVRCSIENPDRALKPEMYATVYMSVEQHKSLAIPHQALLRMGTNTVVFVDQGEKGGRSVYERRAVSVDEGEASEWLPVRGGADAGVSAGDKVVTFNSILLLGLAQ